MNAAGVREVLYEGVNTGEKDFSALITKMKNAGVEVVYWGGLHTEGGLIVRQMRDQGVRAVMMSGDGITSDEFATIGGPGVEGTLMTFPPDPRNRPEAAQVVAAFRAKGINPEAYTSTPYAAVQVIAQAATAANSLDPKVVAAQIRKPATVYTTVIGDLSFNSKGRHHPSGLRDVHLEEGRGRQDHLRPEPVIPHRIGSFGKPAARRAFFVSGPEDATEEASAPGGMKIDMRHIGRCQPGPRQRHQVVLRGEISLEHHPLGIIARTAISRWRMIGAKLPGRRIGAGDAPHEDRHPRRDRAGAAIEIPVIDQQQLFPGNRIIEADPAGIIDARISGTITRRMPRSNNSHRRAQKRRERLGREARSARGRPEPGVRKGFGGRHSRLLHRYALKFPRRAPESQPDFVEKRTGNGLSNSAWQIDASERPNPRMHSPLPSAQDRDRSGPAGDCRADRRVWPCAAGCAVSAMRTGQEFARNHAVAWAAVWTCSS